MTKGTAIIKSEILKHFCQDLGSCLHPLPPEAGSRPNVLPKGWWGQGHRGQTRAISTGLPGKSVMSYILAFLSQGMYPAVLGIKYGSRKPQIKWGLNRIK